MGTIVFVPDGSIQDSMLNSIVSGCHGKKESSAFITLCITRDLQQILLASKAKIIQG